jgi:pimeloyl-ACP methyl ester carboxylesterase
MWTVRQLQTTEPSSNWEPVPFTAIEGQAPSTQAIRERGSTLLNNHPNVIKRLNEEVGQVLERREPPSASNAPAREIRLFAGLDAIAWWNDSAEAIAKKYEWACPFRVKACDEGSIGLFKQDEVGARPLSLAWHDDTAIIIALGDAAAMLDVQYVPSRDDENRLKSLMHRYGGSGYSVETYLEWRAYVGADTGVFEAWHEMRTAGFGYSASIRGVGGILIGRVLRRLSNNSQPTLTNDPTYQARLDESERRHGAIATTYPDLARCGVRLEPRVAVFVHGTFSCGLQSLKEFPPPAGIPVFRYEHDTFRSIDESARELVALIADRLRAKELTLIAHSRGGLVARLATKKLRRECPDKRVSEILTFGTPHLGTPLVAIGKRILSILWKIGETTLTGIPMAGIAVQTFSYLIDAPTLPRGIEEMAEDSGLLVGMKDDEINDLVQSWGGDFLVSSRNSGFGPGLMGMLYGSFKNDPNDLVVPLGSALGIGTRLHRLGCSHINYFIEPPVRQAISVSLGPTPAAAQPSGAAQTVPAPPSTPSQPTMASAPSDAMASASRAMRADARTEQSGAASSTESAGNAEPSSSSVTDVSITEAQAQARRRTLEASRKAGIPLPKMKGK